MRRTQIYLDDGQDEQLARRAAAEGVTKSALIRRAVDDYLQDEDDESRRLSRFKVALEAVAGAAPALPKGSIYVERIRTFDASRQAEIERQRQA